MQFNKSKKSVEASCRDVSRLVVYSSEELYPSNIAFGGRDGSLGAIFWAILSLITLLFCS